MEKQLTKRQEQALAAHAKHHTTKHMQEMRKLMRQGRTFKEAHTLTMKSVGK